MRDLERMIFRQRDLGAWGSSKPLSPLRDGKRCPFFEREPSAGFLLVGGWMGVLRPAGSC